MLLCDNKSLKQCILNPLWMIGRGMIRFISKFMHLKKDNYARVKCGDLCPIGDKLYTRSGWYI